MSVLVDGVLVDPFALTIRDPANVDVPLHGGLRNVRDVKGLSGMSARVSVRPRVGRSGSVAVTRHREDRPVTVELQILAEDTQQALADYHVVSRAVNSAVATDRLLRWTLGTYKLQSLVRAESIEPPTLVAGRILETQIGLRAMDPRGYDQTLLSKTAAAGSGITVVNSGSVDTTPLFLLSNPTLTPVLRNLVTGADFAFNRTWTGTVIVDTARRQVRGITGTLRTDWVNWSVARWSTLEFPPGESQWAMVTGNTSGTLEIQHRHAYQ